MSITNIITISLITLISNNCFASEIVTNSSDRNYHGNIRVIESTFHIYVPVSSAFNWFMDLDKNYLKWHPKAHMQFVWLSDKPIAKGTEFYFEENIEGHKQKLFMLITEFERNKRLSYISKSIHIKSKFLPDSLMLYLISLFEIRIEMNRRFEVVSDNETIIHTKHSLGSHVPIINGLAGWFINTFMLSSNHHANHMKEENENMKSCLESKNKLTP